jgi:hypothetical protein
MGSLSVTSKPTKPSAQGSVRNGHEASRGTHPDTTWTASALICQPETTLVARQKRLDRVRQVLAWRAPMVKCTPESVQVVFGAVGEDFTAAQQDASLVLLQILDLLRLPPSAVGSQKLVSDASLDMEIDGLPECVGLGEAAVLLGVSKQRVHQLAQQPGFPAPVLRLRATPVWRAADVRRYGIWRTNSGRVRADA